MNVIEVKTNGTAGDLRICAEDHVRSRSSTLRSRENSPSNLKCKENQAGWCIRRTRVGEMLARLEPYNLTETSRRRAKQLSIIFRGCTVAMAAIG